MVEYYERAKGALKGVAETGIDLGTKGVGVAGGLIGGKYIGDTVEQIVTTPVTAASPLTDKVIAWLSNNVPKGVGAYLLSRLEVGHEVVDNVIKGATYGLAGSIVVDTYSRSTHKGVPTLILGENKAAEQRVQALLRENSELKTSLQRMQSGTPIVRVEPVTRVDAPPNRPLEKKYEFTPGSTPAEGIPGVVYEKRPLEKRYEFVGKSVTTPEVLTAGFGFLT